MRTWLRMVIVLVTVGGGFTGLVVTTQFLTMVKPGVNTAIAAAFAELYGFVLTAGLLFGRERSGRSPFSGGRNKDGSGNVCGLTCHRETGPLPSISSRPRSSLRPRSPLRHYAWRAHPDCAAHLAAITGQNFGTDFAKWKEWWETNNPGVGFDFESDLGR